jgi:hypothetical protein
MKKPKWLKKLNKKEIKHMLDMDIQTKDKFNTQVEILKVELNKFHNGEPSCVCWDCVSICRKLNIPLE